MRYTVRHATTYTYTEPVPVCHNQVHLAPRNTPYQIRSSHELVIEPPPSVRTKRRDCFGNEVDYFSIQEAHEGLSVTATSVVDVAAPGGRNRRPESPAWEDIAAAIPQNLGSDGLTTYHFTLPSPRVQASAALGEYASESFPKRRPIYAAVRELTSRIHADFQFDAKATTVHTSPEELLELRRGVCQDFAHLAIGCLRSLGLAARYVSGYVRTTPPPRAPGSEDNCRGPGRPRLIGADASHAWVSVFCGPLGWIDFDPTNDAAVADWHITIGWGRDYGDVCPIQGVFVGGGEHRMTVGVDVEPVADKT